MMRLALQVGSAASVQARLAAGDSIDARDSRGRTALMIAAARGHLPICELLLSLGSDVRLVDSEGRTAEQLALQHGHTHIAALLGIATRDLARAREEATPEPSSASCSSPGARQGHASPPPPATSEDEADRATNDLEDWEAEPAAQLPAAQSKVVSSARELQQLISAHRANDRDATPWLDDELSLPEVTRTSVRGRLDPGLSAQLKFAWRRAQAAGLVRPQDFREMLTGFLGPASDYEGEVLRHLEHCLEASGVVIDADIPDEWLVIPESDDETEEDQETTDAEWFSSIELAASGANDPIALWAREVRDAGDLLSPEQEVRLGRALRDGLREAVVAAFRDAEFRQLVLDMLAALASSRASKTAEGSADEGDVESAVDGAEPPADEPLSLPSLESCIQEASVDLRSAAADRQLDQWLERLGFRTPDVLELIRRCKQRPGRDRLLKLLEASRDKVLRARDTFVSLNLRLVWSIARKYLRSGIPLSDLVQEGSLGLVRAVDGFDPERGFRFSTYATWWIRQSVSRAVADKSRLIRVPVHMHERIQDLEQAEERLCRALGRVPSDAEIASETGMAESEVLKVRRADIAVLSTDDPENAHWSEWISPDYAGPVPPEDVVTTAEVRRDVNAVLAQLKPRDATVLAMRFGIPDGDERTLEEVGRSMEVTRERIRQIERKALGEVERRLTQILAPTPLPNAGEAARGPEREAAIATATGFGEAVPHGVEAAPSGGAAPSSPLPLDRGDASSGDAVWQALRLLASPRAQERAARTSKVRSLQREFARRWFEAYAPEIKDESYTATQHAALGLVTDRLRACLRLLGFEWIEPEILLRDESWKMVIEAANDAIAAIDVG
jgi:RNA polymerase primary sigma factor